MLSILTILMNFQLIYIYMRILNWTSISVLWYNLFNNVVYIWTKYTVIIWVCMTIMYMANIIAYSVFKHKFKKRTQDIYYLEMLDFQSKLMEDDSYKLKVVNKITTSTLKLFIILSCIITCILCQYISLLYMSQLIIGCNIILILLNSVETIGVLNSKKFTDITCCMII